MLDKKTRIGLLAPINWSIPPVSYGPWEQDIADIITGLKQIGYHNIILFATKETYIPGVKTIAIIDKPFGDRDVRGQHAWELIHIAHAMKMAENEVDILNNHFNYMPLLFSEFTSKPVVTTLHGCGAEETPSEAFRYYRHLPYISISDAERKNVPELNYVATVYNPINFDQFSFSPVKPGEYLVTMGRMHPNKGIHNSIALAKALNKPLYLAGPIQPESQSYFDTRVAPFIDNKQIFYLGNISSSEVHSWVSRAKAFVGMIEWDEPFGRSIAESMACGTPVIATPMGAHSELVRDGISGIIVKSVEEATKRFHEIESIDREKCRVAAERLYSIPRVAHSLVNAFEKVLEEHTSLAHPFTYYETS